MCRTIHFFLQALFIVVMATRCTSSTIESKEIDSKPLRKQNTATEVNVVKAEKKPFNYQIHSNGQVKSNKEAMLIFKVAGAIETLLVKDGDYVKKGQLLAKLNTQEHALALEKAQINLKEQQIKYQHQLLGISNKGDSAQVAMVKSNLSYTTGLRAAELAFKEAKVAFNNTSIRAPFNGVVSNVTFNKGTTIKQGDKLCEVSTLLDLWVQTEVLESVISKVKIDQKAIIKPMALAKTFTATMQTINPRVNKNGMVKLGLKIKNPKGLMPGMNVAVIINAPYNKNIIIPETALVIRSGKEVVFVAEDNLAKWKYVTTGLKSNNQVEVLTGLVEGDMVITTNNIYLAHDAPVITN